MSRMRILKRLFLNCSVFALMPVIANAAGTYYTGYYQRPQQSYSSQNYAQRQTGYSIYNRNYSSPSYSSTRYTAQNTSVSQNSAATSNSVTSASAQKSGGFWLDAGVSRETAMWQFDMKESGSILHYDNVSWNVFDAQAGYLFDLGNTKMQVNAGFKYGTLSMVCRLASRLWLMMMLLMVGIL